MSRKTISNRKASGKPNPGPSRIDRRAARSRALLHRALLDLIAKHGYDGITVEDICKAADVGRSTFYAHYAGKDDLMRSGLKAIRDVVGRGQKESAANPKERRLKFSLAMFEHARDHMHLHHALADGRGGAIASATIRQILSDMVRSELAAAGAAKDGPPREMVVQYVVGAYMAVVGWWLHQGETLQPSQIDAMFQRLIREGIALR